MNTRWLITLFLILILGVMVFPMIYMVILSFQSAQGLMVGTKEPLMPVKADPTGKLSGFTIAGATKQFVWADAVIKGNTVEVTSTQVAVPAAVRYGWASNPPCNLYSKAGLPASPFRTDTW